MKRLFVLVVSAIIVWAQQAQPALAQSHPLAGFCEGGIVFTGTRYTRVLAPTARRHPPDRAREFCLQPVPGASRLRGRRARHAARRLSAAPGDGQGPDAYLARQPYFQAMERFLVHETAIHLIDTSASCSARSMPCSPGCAGSPRRSPARMRAHPVPLRERRRRPVRRQPAERACQRRAQAHHGRDVAGGLGRRAAARWQSASGCSRTAGGAPARYAFEDRNFGGDCVYRLQRTCWSIVRAERRSRTTPRAILRNVDAGRNWSSMAGRAACRPRRECGERCVVAPERLRAGGGHPPEAVQLRRRDGIGRRPHPRAQSRAQRDRLRLQRRGPGRGRARAPRASRRAPRSGRCTASR